MDDILHGHTHKKTFGCGNVYITINYDGQKVQQVLVTAGKAGGCQHVMLETICRLVNTMLDDGKAPDDILNLLAGMRCDKGTVGNGRLSCVEAIAYEMKTIILANQQVGAA